MKKIACCLGIGLLFAACFEDETIHADYVDYGRGYDTTSTNPVWKYVSQYYYKFGKEIILDPDTSDYMFNFQSKNEVRIVPPRQDEAHLSEALQFLREMFLDGYSDHVKEKIFPYAVILGDSIINVSSEPYVKMDICTATSYVAFLVNDEMIGKTEEEKAEDPAKENTGLFFFRGDSGAKFAICNAGQLSPCVGIIQAGVQRLRPDLPPRCPNSL